MDNTTHTMCLHYRLRCARDYVKLGVFVTKRTICSYEYMKITYENRGVENNAPINVNPVGRECGQGVGIWQILKFFDQIPQDGKQKVNQKCQKRPHPREKNLNKQYYNTI